MASAVKTSQVSAQTLTAPQGIAVDGASNLYVADMGANRVLVFPNTQNAPQSGEPAAFVIGQPDFNTVSNTTSTSNTASNTASGSGLKGPEDIAIDSGGSIYVADT